MNKTKFWEGINDWNNHLVLLWYALEATQGDVVEMGCGMGSTRQMHEYCKDKGRNLFSFETEEKYIEMFADLQSAGPPFHVFHRIINNWHTAKDTCPNPSVILIDHAPGERRIVDVARFEDFNGIMVMHDTQPKPTAADYGYERIWHLWKYKIDLRVPVNIDKRGRQHNRTWASAVSNYYDVTQWKGFETADKDYVLCVHL